MLTRAVSCATMCYVLGCAGTLAQPLAGVGEAPPPPDFLPPSTLLQPQPLVLRVALLARGIDSATISDVAVADFDGDGRNDVAAAWFATDQDNMAANMRVLSFFFNRGGALERGTDIDLYIPDYALPARSVFRNGTSAIAVGDFDGDGDPDLAVFAYFGDEVWFIENRGAGDFAAHLRFPFGYNSTGNFITPPDALAGDFDGDGRDELVYLVDPNLHPDGALVHFWKTSGGIADIDRVYWQGEGSDFVTQWTRGLAVADFDGDGRLDVCFTGTSNPPFEDHPLLTFWYGLDLASGLFHVRNEFPDMLCSDIVDVRPVSGGPRGFLLSDLAGSTVEYWQQVPGPLHYAPVATVHGYAAIPPARGMTEVLADMNADGYLDLVTKQRSGDVQNGNQIDVTLYRASDGAWRLVHPAALDTSGFRVDPSNQILRPRNLAVADLLGNTRPEIVAGFGSRSVPAAQGMLTVLDVAVWRNGCSGDVNADGQTNASDVGLLVAALGKTRGQPGFNPDADLDKDGCIDTTDLRLLLQDYGCQCGGCDDQVLADMDCDGLVNFADIDGFVTAIGGEDAYRARYPTCNWLNGDCTGDYRVDFGDIEPFVEVLSAMDMGVAAPELLKTMFLQYAEQVPNGDR